MPRHSLHIVLSVTVGIILIILPSYSYALFVPFRYDSVSSSHASLVPHTQTTLSPHTAQILISFDSTKKSTDASDNVVLTSIPLSYHRGDIAGTEWTKAYFNDSAWGRLYVDSGERISDTAWSGIGCFRLRVRIVPHLRNSALIFRVRHAGNASEIYWDGRLLYCFGKVGATANTEEPYSIIGNSVPLYCDSSEEHLLAVRFSSYPRFDDDANGFRLRVLNMRWEDYLVFFTQLSLLQEGSIVITFTAAFILAILHVLMFFAYRKNPMHLWIAMMWSVLALSQGLALIDRYFTADYTLITYAILLSDVLLVGAYQFSLIVLYRICYGRVSRRIFLVSGIFALFVVHRLLPVQIRLLSWNWSLLPVALALALESGRVILAFGNRIPNIRILGIGLVCSFICYVGSTFFYDYLFLLLGTYTPGRLLQQFTILVYPMSFTVYAAWEFTRRERLLARQNAELEAEVEARTAELRAANLEIQATNQALNTLNHELEASNSELEAANQFKVQMLSIAAHDLRNPLGVISVYAELLRETTLPNSSEANMLHGIQSSTSQMLELVKDILDTSALEMGRLELEYAHLNWGLQILTLCDGYCSSLENKKQTIDTSGVTMFSLWGDEARLLQVADNLISNAIKYSRLGGFICISLSEQDSCARLTVQDSGPGFTDEDKAKLFGHFQRLSAQPTGGEISTGVGLSIVKKIVELHHGRIWMETVQGEGSSFIVEIPHKKGAEFSQKI